MIFMVAVLACGALALACAVHAVTLGTRRRMVGAAVYGLAGIAALALAGVVALAVVDLSAYERLTAEAPVVEVRFRQQGEGRYAAELLYPDGASEAFDLAGDEWQLDARVLKWHGFAARLGLEPVFRVERIGGRYRDIEDERNQMRTVFETRRPPGIDLWRLARRLQRWLPWVDAAYGSATFLPMADGAHFAVSISSTGLLARPLNRAAREAMSAWH